jgi:mRNA interferase RelE/StbE
MPWDLRVERPAQRDLLNLPDSDRVAVERTIDRFKADPSSVDMAKLNGQRDLWRVRVGQWRIIAELNNRDGLIRIHRVVHRRDAYR